MTKRSPSRSRGGAADKIWAVGLAGATCVGLVGAVGVRTAQDAAAAAQVPASTEVTSASPQANVAVTSSGLTEAQLDEYALALEGERARLDAYHAELLDAAARLQEAADALNQGRSGAVTTQAQSAAKPATEPVPKPASKPVPKPAAAPQVAKPQAQTRGS